MDKVNLAAKFGLIDEYWSPRVAGELNGQQVKLARLKGEFIWHHHEREDEFFLVVSGRLLIELPERTVTLDPGEFLIVPRGVEHRPLAPTEAHVLMFEPKGTLNTGNVRDVHTIEDLPTI